MIIDFTITNFRSIRDEQTISFFAENPGKHLLDNISYPTTPKIGVLKTAGIYGGNASGKSNILLAFEALQFLISASGRLKDGKTIRCYEPYRLSKKSKSAPVIFEIEFCIKNGTRYIYKVSFTRDRIIEEHLSYYKSTKPAVIFERTEEDNWETIKFGTLFTGGKKRFPFFNNNAYLSIAGSSADAPKLIRDVYNYFQNDVLRLGLNENIDLDAWIENQAIFDKATSFLGCVDTGVSGVVVKEREVDLGNVHLPENMPNEIKDSILREMKRSLLFIHMTDTDETELFDIRLESAGTRKLFHLAPLIVDALENGGVLIVDELDNSMHPFMAALIIRLFNDPKVNCGNAQLIFSTHNLNLMTPEHFRRDQIWLTEKSKGATSFFSLEDFDKKKVKPQSPFTRWYVEGRFGAIPKIDYQGIAALLKKKNGVCDAQKEG